MAKRRLDQWKKKGEAGRRKKKGLFITFEGGEGAGKSTQIEMLKEYLRGKGNEVVVTREPGGTPLGEDLRRILLESDLEISGVSEALLIAADRAEHVAQVIRPALERGAVVISDRYTDSSMAYQGVGRGLGLEAVRNLNDWATEELWPNLTFYLEVPFETGLGRNKSEPDRFEREEAGFHEKVSHGYKMLSRMYPNRIVMIEGTAKVKEVHERIVDRVSKML